MTSLGQVFTCARFFLAHRILCAHCTGGVHWCPGGFSQRCGSSVWVVCKPTACGCFSTFASMHTRARLLWSHLPPTLMRERSTPPSSDPPPSPSPPCTHFCPLSAHQVRSAPLVQPTFGVLGALPPLCLCPAFGSQAASRPLRRRPRVVWAQWLSSASPWMPVQRGTHVRRGTRETW